MSLKQLLPQLAALQAKPGTGKQVAWKALYADRRQPLLVPLDLAQARRSIAFFMRNPLLRWWGQLLLTLDRWLPRAQLLPLVQLEHFPGSAMFGDDELAGAALFCGSPGPLQKLTLYCPDCSGGLGKVAKLALAPNANHAIKQEANWLHKLGRNRQLADFLPRMLLQGALLCGRHYIVMQALPTGYSSARFGQRHFSFLRLMAQQQPALFVWNKSQAFIRLQKRLGRIMHLIDKPYRDLLLSVLVEIDRGIGHRELPVCATHNDFAPWNLRLSGDRLFVFDWEYAEECGNPLQDFLHFRLLRRALKRWPWRNSDMSALLAETTAYADTMFGADSGVAAASGALTLHYLLDVISFYVEASGYLAPEHPVMRTYLRLLRERAQWLPASPTAEAIHSYDRHQYGAP